MEFDSMDIPMNKLLVTTLEGRFMIFDMKTFHPEKGYSYMTEKLLMSSTVWFGRSLPQNKDIFMISSAGNLHLYK